MAYAQDELVVISPHWEGIRYEFGERFKRLHKERTGRTVEIKWLAVGGTSDILKYIRSESKTKPNGIGIDLFFGGGIDPYMELKDLGLLQRCEVNPELLAKIPPDLNGAPIYDTDRTWYAPMMAGFGIIYNKRVLRMMNLPEPETWADLAKPEFFSWVGSADPSKSGSQHMAYEIILQAYGWEEGWRIIFDLSRNVRAFTSAASQSTQDVALGEVAYGMCIDSYAWAQMRLLGEDRIGFVLPKDLSFVNGDAIAMLKNAPNPELARAFIEFCMSRDGQTLLILPKGVEGGPEKHELVKFSVMPELYDEFKDRAAVKLNPFEWKSKFRYDSALGAGRWRIFNDLFRIYVIDHHSRLADTAPDFTGALVAEIPNDAAVQGLIKDGTWASPEARTRLLSEWTARARTLYGTNHSGGWWWYLPTILLFAMLAFMLAKQVFGSRKKPRTGDR